MQGQLKPHVLPVVDCIKGLCTEAAAADHGNLEATVSKLQTCWAAAQADLSEGKAGDVTQEAWGYAASLWVSPPA